VKAVLLVGGEGTRLRPLTWSMPKGMVPIANQPFLDRQLTWLARHGVDEVILSLGYLPDAFHAHFPDDRFGPIRLRYAVEPKPLGTAGGIRFAAEGIDERFVVCNGDNLTALDLGAMIKFHDERGAEASIYLTRVADPSAFGVVPTRPDGEVVGFVEKPPRDQAPTNWINAGIYVLEPALLERVPERMNVSIEREVFPRMVSTRSALYAYQYDGYWLDIGTPATYLQANADVLAGELGVPPAPDAVDHGDCVWVQPGGRPAEDARLEGPLLIGSGAVVASGATVTASVLGAGASVGEGARVVRSVLFPGARVAPGAEIIDSVLGAGSVLQDGAVIADVTIVGAAIQIPAGTHISGGRIPADEAAARATQ
jgi:NDP-sugar pyrophosphorylase family protein